LTVAFLDEEELRPAPGGSGPRRPVPDRQRQVMMRRVIALGVGVLLIILVLLGIRGCLNARKERGFENYLSDLGSIATQSNQLSSEFFNRLEDPPKGEDEQELQAQIASDRGTAENLLQRTEDLSTPDELNDPQSELVTAFTLRRDALTGIAEDIPNALGSADRSAALDRLTADMKALLASDVLYARAQDDIDRVLSEEAISGDVPPSAFLPEPIDRWIDKLQLSTVLASFATDTGTTSGLHGLALLSASINKTPLTADADNSVGLGNDPVNLTVEVQNQGDQEESGITVSYTLSGGAIPIEGEDAISKLDAQGINEITLPFESKPETGVPMTLEIEILPVPGEEVVDNNRATYTITFD